MILVVIAFAIYCIAAASNVVSSYSGSNLFRTSAGGFRGLPVVFLVGFCGLSIRVLRGDLFRIFCYLPILEAAGVEPEPGGLSSRLSTTEVCPQARCGAGEPSGPSLFKPLDQVPSRLQPGATPFHHHGRPGRTPSLAWKIVCCLPIELPNSRRLLVAGFLLISHLTVRASGFLRGTPSANREASDADLHPLLPLALKPDKQNQMDHAHCERRDRQRQQHWGLFRMSSPWCSAF